MECPQGERLEVYDAVAEALQDATKEISDLTEENLLLRQSNQQLQMENFHLKKQLEGQSIQLSGIKEEKEQLKKGHDYLIDEVGFRNKQIQMNSNIEKSLLAIQETLSELQESVTNALSLSLTDCALAVQDTDNLERRVDLGVEVCLILVGF
jgi:chromosome segregation ATPase